MYWRGDCAEGSFGFFGGFDLKGQFLIALRGEIQDEGAAEGGEAAVEGLGGVGGDEEEGAVVVGMFPGVFDCGAALADATHVLEGALAFDHDGAFGGKVLAEFGEELIAAFQQGESDHLVRRLRE